MSEVRIYIFSKKVSSKENQGGFTLIELMIVILIVGILAAAAIPIFRGRVNEAKWSEGKTTAGSIRRAISAYVLEKGVATAQQLIGSLDDETKRSALGFYSNDLTGAYFVAGDFNIDAVNGDGSAQVTVTASTANGPTAGETRTLSIDGIWQ
ncbi:MAG: pilin [Planctomycetota bacterium]|jgi:prepilin-type N-terminal cleavage/methylation domain-containing protein